MPTKIIIRKRQGTAERFIEKVDGLNLAMVRIPAGSFIMGAPETEAGSSDDERPQHLVTVPEFCMAQTQITQAQWRIVAGYDPVNQDLDPDPAHFKGDDRPVERVSWLDAKEFCARLSEKTGKKYRLPTEAEWEYACRAVRGFQLPITREELSKTGEARIIEEWNRTSLQPFHFGETISTEIVNYDGKYIYGRGAKGEYRGRTTPVVSFPTNAFGLYDMHGNVWEWCEDDYHETYEGAPADGLAWLNEDDKDTSRVLRGGSWFDVPVHCRSADRYYTLRDNRSNGIGFRVVVSPQ